MYVFSQHDFVVNLFKIVHVINDKVVYAHSASAMGLSNLLDCDSHPPLHIFQCYSTEGM